MSVEQLYEGIKGYGHKDVTLVPEKKEIPGQLLPRLMPGDMVFTLGAGDVWKVGEELIPLLKKGEAVKGSPKAKKQKSGMRSERRKPNSWSYYKIRILCDSQRSLR